MADKMIHVGFDNYIFRNYIVAIAKPDSAPIKRSINNAMDKSVIIDMTKGRKTKSVIYTQSKYIILSCLTPETIKGRLEE